MECKGPKVSISRQSTVKYEAASSFAQQRPGALHALAPELLTSWDYLSKAQDLQMPELRFRGRTTGLATHKGLIKQQTCMCDMGHKYKQRNGQT